MVLTTAQWLVSALMLYAVVGVLFAAAFVVAGVGRIDPSAKDGTWGFRLLILPGAAAFWPLLASRWLRGRREPPVEKNPHRDAAEERR